LRNNLKRMPQKPSTTDDKVLYTTWTQEKVDRLLRLRKALDEGNFDEEWENVFPRREQPPEPSK
jgi:hypothetical protein